MLNVLRERRMPTAAYPIRGFAHFLHHPQRHAGPIFLSIVKVIAASSVVVIPLYRYGFGFQHTLLERAYNAFFSSHSSMDSLLIKVSSLALCLLETSATTLQIGNHFIGNIRARLFDSVLKERKGLPQQDDSDAHLASISEKVAGPATTATNNKNKYHFLSPRYLMILSAQQDDDWSIFFLRSALFVLTLPLNVVPVVGPLCFISIQALFRGGVAHKRYFQLYKWTSEQRQRRIETYFWQYQRFGLVATALEMLPFVGYLFMYTNQVGAALWAMDLHDRKLLEPSATNNASSASSSSPSKRD